MSRFDFFQEGGKYERLNFLTQRKSCSIVRPVSQVSAVNAFVTLVPCVRKRWRDGEREGERELPEVVKKMSVSRDETAAAFRTCLSIYDSEAALLLLQERL